MNRRTLLLYAILGCLLLTSLSAQSSPAAPQPSGKVVIGSTSEIIYLDPLLNTFVNDTNLLYANLYDALVLRKPDGSLGPNLAESWRQTMPTQWEFKLRRGVKFHNGEPFNAVAVKANVDRFLEPGKQRAPHIAKPIKGATVVDEYTVRIDTDKPDPAFFENTIVWLFMVAPGAYKTLGEEGMAAQPSGPAHSSSCAGLKAATWRSRRSPNTGRGNRSSRSWRSA